MSSKLSSKFRNEVSWNGYTTDVLKSGLQKYIRRGNIEKALYCAGELDLFKESEDRGETIRTNFIHRLMIIYLEDTANLAIFDDIYTKLQCLVKERTIQTRSKEKEEKLISEVVTILCNSTKARICSHIRAVFNPTYNNPKLLDKYPSIKNYWNEINNLEENNYKQGLESDCKKFKSLLKDKNILCVYYAFKIYHSEEKLKEKCFKKSKPVWYIFKELQTPFNITFIDKFMSLYSEHLDNLKEGYLCWLVPLLKQLDIIPDGDKPEYAAISCEGWERNRRGELIEIDEFVKDKHTRKGIKKGLVEFALNGAYVENEAKFVNKLWKEFYEDGKRLDDGVELSTFSEKVPKNISTSTSSEKVHETNEYNFIVRAQLNTSKNKQDTYFAKDSTDKLVLVKGPFPNESTINILKRNIEWKKLHNLPYINFEIKEMIPDRWPEGIPLGIRNTIDRSTLAYFIIFDSVISEDILSIKTHSSKLWPETEVVNWDKILLHFDYKDKSLSEQEIIDYVHNILYRYVCGIPDLADRNFLMVNGRVISIDEEIENNTVDIASELRKNKASFIHNWLKDNYEKLNISSWLHQTDRLDKIKNKNTCLELFKPLA